MRTRAIAAAFLLACPLAAAAVAGCAQSAAGGAIAAEDQALLDEARTFVFSFASGVSCSELVDEDPTGLGDVLGGAPLQLADASKDSYTFGKVPANEDIAYLVLVSSASKSDLGNRPQFESFEGTIFAIGCRDLNAASGTRQELPITVFAAGLR